MGSYKIVPQEISDLKVPDEKEKTHMSHALSENNQTFGFSGKQSNTTRIPRWRRIMPQALCSVSMSLICINIGITLSFPSIVVEEILNVTKNANHSLPKPGFFKDIYMTEDQVSLYVGLAYLCQPIGSIFGGWAIGKMGRKKLMVFVNVPFSLGWIILFFSQSVDWMYVSNFLLGMGIGFCEGTFATYIPEICEPSTRGILLGKVLLMYAVSLMVPYLVFLALPDWRWCGLALTGVPLITLLVCLAVPETPHWLASRGMDNEARKSLMVLRGWVPQGCVRQEFQELLKYHQQAPPSVSNTSKWKEWKEKLLYMVGFRMRSPFLLICSMFTIAYLSGTNTMRPFISVIFTKMGSNKTVQEIGMLLTLSGILGGFVTFLVIKFTGKKLLLIGSLIVGGILSIILALTELQIIDSYLVIYWFSIFSFFNSLGVHPIPWMMQGDLFPFRGRGLASGITAAFNYLVGFVCTSLFMTVMDLIGLEGVFFLFAGCNFVGSVYLWIYMPETEGKSHMEIDQYYEEEMKKRFC